MVGSAVGEIVGDVVGNAVGFVVGTRVGTGVGELVNSKSCAIIVPFAANTTHTDASAIACTIIVKAMNFSIDRQDIELLGPNIVFFLLFLELL